LELLEPLGDEVNHLALDLLAENLWLHVILCYLKSYKKFVIKDCRTICEYLLKRRL
jgi:hypothetical protein